MNYIFVTDNSFKENNPVFSICLNLARCFVRRGDVVTILGNCETDDAPRDEMIEGIRFVRFYYPINPITRRILQDYQKNHSLGQMLLSLLRHPIAGLVGALRAVFGLNPIEYRYARMLRQLCKEGSADAIVSFSAPYYTAMGLARAKTGAAVKIAYTTDPYATHYQMGGKRASRQEAAVLRRVNHAVTTPELYEEYKSHSLARYLNKMTALEFPCVVPRPFSSQCTQFAADKTNCLFAGNFYATIRPPTYLLELAAAIKDPNWHLTLMGHIENSLSESDRRLLQQLEQQGRVTCVASQPPETAHAAMAQADVLINLGNSIKQMMPSKIYDYIVTGRPIINIYTVEDCPSLSRLEKYPLVLNLFAGNSAADNAAMAEAFCRQSAGKKISWQQILQIYDHCTPAYACNILEQLAKN